MVIYFRLDEHFRLYGWSNTRSHVDDIELEVANNHDVLNNPFVYKFERGEIVKDEGYQQELIDQEEAEANKISEIEKLEQALMELTIMVM